MLVLLTLIRCMVLTASGISSWLYQSYFMEARETENNFFLDDVREKRQNLIVTSATPLVKTGALSFTN